MRRERALKIVLVLVGLIFCALAYPLVMFVKQAPALAMQFSVYVTLGIFLLFASRNPSANRSLIAFTAWSSFVHALMAGQAFAGLIARGELCRSRDGTGRATTDGPHALISDAFSRCAAAHRFGGVA